MAMLGYKPFFALCIVFLLLSGCSSRYTSNNSVASPHKDADKAAEVKEGHSAILFMTDLEIIKRATDHLKKRGEKVAFEETEISVHRSEREALIFYDVSGKPITHKGDYMRIVLYPSKKSLNHEYNKCFTVYMDQNGNTLGYTSQTITDD
ncbi:MAG: hypothetical protein GX094_04755 [Clostridiales bacterium]|jgi:hypothetical protein|nr:hypothetical protein [Clostridiales bacterium]